MKNLKLVKHIFSAFIIIVGIQGAVWASEYQKFNQFCKNEFGAKNEKLVYKHFGKKLSLIPSGFWIHESLNSAAIAFETNLPAITHIEYGKTKSYGYKTQRFERHTYLHLHHLRGLQPNTRYHYRLIAKDERGRTIYSSGKMLRTRTFNRMKLITESVGKLPYELNRPYTTYVLARDANAKTRAFTINAPGVTLDLNGHTIIFDDGKPIIANAQWDKYVYSDRSTFGVFSTLRAGKSKLLNGKIIQGKNQSKGHIGLGFNPIHVARSEGGIEIAGIIIGYGGHSVSGIVARHGDNHIHHNIVRDVGIGIDNRHQGIKAIWVSSTSFAVHHNLVARTRHQGIMPAKHQSKIYSNEIYIDSWATNSFGIKPTGDVYRNKIFGTGYHTVAIGWSEKPMKIHDNFIHLQGTAPLNRSGEYGPLSSVNGIRLTQYGRSQRKYENNEYYNNTIVVKGRQGTQNVRGVQFFSDPYVKNLMFRNNIIKAIADDGQTQNVYCVVAQGLPDHADKQLPINYNNNTFVSNSCFVRFGDKYGSGGNHQFRNNRFIKIGNNSDFRTLHLGFWKLHSYGNFFIDTVLEGGASLEDAVFEGSGRRDYSVGHSAWIMAKDTAGKPIANTSVMILNKIGRSFLGKTDVNGRVKVEFFDYLMQPNKSIRANKTDKGEKITFKKHLIRVYGFEDKTVQTTNISRRKNRPTVITFKKSL